jgi:hypothetical protein
MSTLPLNAGTFPLLSTGFDSCPEQLRKDKRAAVLNNIAHSERLISVRPASQLKVRPRPEMFSSGIAELDAITGGIPRGCLTEICGTASSGKTSLLLATIAAASRREESCVLIDASDSFDPASGMAAGLDLTKLLWIRCSQHKLSYKARARMPASPKSTRIEKSAPSNFKFVEARASSPVLKLEQVLKATDLILQSGGFGLVALDLAGIPEKFVRRIPLTSWFRFQRAVEHTKTALMVVSEFSCAQTCAALAVKLCNELSAFSHQSSGKTSHAQVLEGMNIQAEIMRSRLERKPMQSVKTAFMTQAVRAG